MTKDILYLASQSKSRQHLLELAQISFKVLEHASDENIARNGASFNDYVLAIAQHKMQALTLPTREEAGKDYMFVLTADSLVRNPRTDAIFGKPTDRDHARAMLTAERQGPVEVVTGCCLEKYIFKADAWQRDGYEHWTTGAMVEFYVDDENIDKYLKTLPMALYSSGAGIVEDHGLSYLKSVNGSYTAITGLPLYELRQALKKLGFAF